MAAAAVAAATATNRLLHKEGKTKAGRDPVHHLHNGPGCMINLRMGRKGKSFLCIQELIIFLD